MTSGTTNRANVVPALSGSKIWVDFFVIHKQRVNYQFSLDINFTFCADCCICFGSVPLMNELRQPVFTAMRVVVKLFD